MDDFGIFCFDPLGRVNFDHIESRLKLCGIAGQIHLCCGTEARLLVSVYKFPRLGKLRAFAKLDLHEKEVFAVGGNRVCLLIAPLKPP